LAESSAPVLLVCMITASVLACIVVYTALLRSSVERRTPSLENSLDRIIAQTEARELRPLIPTSIVRSEDETFYWEQSALSVAIKPRVRRSRRSAEFSVAQLRDVRWPRRAGRVARAAVDVEDKGCLYLSDERILFVGFHGATEVPLTELVAVDRLPDGVKIVPREGSTRLFVTGDPQAGIVLQRLLNDDTHPHLTADAVVAAAEAHLRRGKITPG
jgi:hypothetical protein